MPLVIKMPKFHATLWKNHVYNKKYKNIFYYKPWHCDNCAVQLYNNCESLVLQSTALNHCTFDDTQ